MTPCGEACYRALNSHVGEWREPCVSFFSLPGWFILILCFLMDNFILYDEQRRAKPVDFTSPSFL